MVESRASQGAKRRFPWRLRSFNKHVLNRLTWRLAGFSHGPFAVVRHVGRRSGKSYETPIMVEPISDGFVIALTYGPDVDWYRNVRAAGGGGLRWHGKEYVINKLEPIDVETGLLAFPPLFRVILKPVGIRDFVKMKAQTAE